MECKRCKKWETKGRRDLCDRCYAKQWRKDNPDKIKAYLHKSEKHRNEVARIWRENNPESISKYECSEKRKKEQLIKRKTRHKYPLKNQECIFCNKRAEHRHHTSNPIHIDKFVFLCKRCHDKIHGRKNYRKDAVLGGIDG